MSFQYQTFPLDDNQTPLLPISTCFEWSKSLFTQLSHNLWSRHPIQK